MIAKDTLIDTMAGAAPSASCIPESFQEAVLAAVARAGCLACGGESH